MLFALMKKFLISRSRDKIFFTNPIIGSKKHRGAIYCLFAPTSLLHEASSLLSYTIIKMLRAQSSLPVVTESRDRALRKIDSSFLLAKHCLTDMNQFICTGSEIRYLSLMSIKSRS